MNASDFIFALNLAFIAPFLFTYVMLSIAGMIKEASQL